MTKSGSKSMNHLLTELWVNGKKLVHKYSELAINYYF